MERYPRNVILSSLSMNFHVYSTNLLSFCKHIVCTHIRPTRVPIKSSLGSFNPFRMHYPWMKEVSQQEAQTIDD